MTKLGIIRCSASAEKCAGYKCFPALREKTGTFAEYEDELELVGFDTCGGCARNEAGKIIDRVVRLRDRGAEVIHLANCLANACPWANMFRDAIIKETGVPVVLRTHP
ncbi:MAG: CGGC domain-containing protein [Chloroflexota bacterium]